MYIRLGVSLCEPPHIYIGAELSKLPKHIKLDIKGVDCKNIYYIDSQNKYNGVEIPNKQSSDFKLSLKVSPLVNGKQKIVKRTYKFSKLETLKSAIKFVVDKRLELFELVKSGEYHRPTKSERTPTVKELGDIYWNSKQIAPKTGTVMKAFAGKWIKHLFNVPITDVTTTQLQAVVNKMLDEGKAPSSTLYVSSVLNPIFKRMINEGVMRVNPLAVVQFPKFDNVVYVNISNRGVQALLNEIYEYPKEPYRTIFIWLTRGRRLNEVLSMHYEDLNLDDMSYIIRPENNKVRRHMEYGLTQELVELIEAIPYILSLDIDIPIAERRGRIFNAPLAGGKLTGRTVWYHWKKLIKLVDAGREDSDIPNSDDFLSLRIHDIRHIIGNTLVSNGKTLEEVAAVLGHTSTNVTKRYSKVRRTVSDRDFDDLFDVVSY